MNKPLVLDRRRDFGSIITDAFQFIKLNGSIIFRAYLIYILPIILLMGVMSYFTQISLSTIDPTTADINSASTIFVQAASIIGFLLVCMIVILAILNATAISYKENGMKPVSFEVLNKKIKQTILSQLLAVIVQFLCSYGIIIVAALFLFISIPLGVFLMVIAFFAVMYFYVVYSILPIALIDRDKGLSDAFSSCARLINDNWWSTFGVFGIGSIIAGFMSYIFVIPATIVGMMLSFGLESTEITESIFSRGLLAIVSIVDLIGRSVSYIYIGSIFVIKYYDLVERKDNTNLKARIAAIGVREDSFFENEGEF